MKNRIMSISGICLVILFSQSCSRLEDFGNINNNPNATTEPITSALFTDATSRLGVDLYYGAGQNSNSALYCQYISETQYTEASRYFTPVSNWDAHYSGPMYDLQSIININSDPSTAAKAAANGSASNQIATARILKAFYFWALTDWYGDLPYFEALKGNGILAYDEQSEIYPALLNELKDAVDQFDGGPAFKGDIIYNGDISKWRKLANSIRLMMALRMSKVNPTLGMSEFNAALNHPAGVIENNFENMQISFPGGVFAHTMYIYYNVTQRFDFGMSKTIGDILNSMSDARINAYGSSTKGVPYGLTRDNAVTWINANPDWAYIFSASNRMPTSPMSYISAANIYLARAEAAQIGWTSENSQTMYSLGIQRSWEQWNVYNPSSFSSYMSQSTVSLATGNALTKIQLQQWLSHYPDGRQGWANWRRTNQPLLTPAPGAGKPIPRRIPYGPNEFNLNPSNANQAASQYTVGGVPNSQDAKMWWDQ